MKQYLVIIAVSLMAAASGSAFAQSEEGHDKEGPERPGHRRMQGRGFDDPMMMIERMSEHLALDEVQRQSIANIMDAAKPEFEVVRNESRENREAIRSLDVSDPDYGAKLQDLAAKSGG